MAAIKALKKLVRVQDNKKKRKKNKPKNKKRLKNKKLIKNGSGVGVKHNNKGKKNKKKDKKKKIIDYNDNDDNNVNNNTYNNTLINDLILPQNLPFDMNKATKDIKINTNVNHIDPANVTLSAIHLSIDAIHRENNNKNSKNNINSELNMKTVTIPSFCFNNNENTPITASTK